MVITINESMSEIVIDSHERAKGEGWRRRELPECPPIHIDPNVELVIDEPWRKKFKANQGTRILPRLQFIESRRHSFQVMNMKLAWIDGEGSNVIGPPVMVPAKKNLPPRFYSNQNYTFLNVLFETPPTPFGERYKYIISKDADGNELENGRLSSYEILNWLCSLPPRYAYCGFYLTYDVEMWLRDLDWESRERLKETNQVHWGGFYIKWIPGTMFRVIRDRVLESNKKITSNTKRKTQRKRERNWFKCWDAFKFFQMSFINALYDWKLGTPEELDIIQRGKDNRKDFSRVDVEVRRYAREESELGLALIVGVRDVLKRLGLSLTGFHGAGAVADALFRKYGVSELPPVLQPPPLEIVLRSYFGGRFDTSAVGFIGNAIEYDINSAYPNHIRNLPCPAHSQWRETQNYVEDDYSLWHVRWNLAPSELWSPFPYRTRTGDIRYLRSGEGWYYGCEVRAAFKLCKDIQVLEGYQFVCTCNERPFHWIEDIYSERQALKSAGDLAEKMLKLGMNAGYGKLAESKTPRPNYQNMLYAGLITAMTRAQLMEAVALNPAGVVALATDAVICTSEIPSLDITPGKLGAWERIDVEDVMILQNGLYHSPTLNPKTGRPLMSATRGFHELDWIEARQRFKDGEQGMLVKAHSFLGFDKAAESPKLNRMQCHWVDEHKRLSFWSVLDLKDHRDGRLYPKVNEDEAPSYRNDFTTIVPLTNDWEGALHLISELVTVPDPHEERRLDVTDEPSITIRVGGRQIVTMDSSTPLTIVV